MKNLIDFINESGYQDAIKELADIFKRNMLKDIELKKSDFDVTGEVCTLDNISHDPEDVNAFYSDRSAIRNSAITTHKTSNAIRVTVINRDNLDGSKFIKINGEFDTNHLNLKTKKVTYVEMSKEIMDELLK